jgi:hypothetical protein
LREAWADEAPKVQREQTVDMFRHNFEGGPVLYRKRAVINSRETSRDEQRRAAISSSGSNKDKDE